MPETIPEKLRRLVDGFNKGTAQDVIPEIVAENFRLTNAPPDH